jgi:hypothetical protein
MAGKPRYVQLRVKRRGITDYVLFALPAAGNKKPARNLPGERL